MLNAKNQRFPRDFRSQTTAATKYEFFFYKRRSSAHCSLLLPCIRTSEQLTNGFERTSQEREFIAGVAEMFSSVLSKVAARFVRDQRGATMLEYGLLVGLVAIAAIIAVTAMGGALSTMFSNAAAEL
jgi:pilus assembly protein Flp/PilA